MFDLPVPDIENMDCFIEKDGVKCDHLCVGAIQVIGIDNGFSTFIPFCACHQGAVMGATMIADTLAMRQHKPVRKSNPINVPLPRTDHPDWLN